MNACSGHNFWFFVNGMYLGEETHNGTSDGSVGFALFNFNSEQRETVEFKDLTIRALQTGSVSSSQPFAATATHSLNADWLPALAHELQPLN